MQEWARCICMASKVSQNAVACRCLAVVDAVDAVQNKFPYIWGGEHVIATMSIITRSDTPCWEKHE